jgi:hypothetical protein
MFDMTKRIALGVALAIPAVAASGAANPVGAADGAAPDSPPLAFCSGHAQTKEQMKAGEAMRFVCYATFEEAMDAVGIRTEAGDTPEAYATRVRRGGLRTTESGSSTTSADGEFLLAVHYGVANAPNGATPSYMPVGPNCNDFGINIAGTYVDNWIKSTRPVGCSKVKHFDAPGLGSGYTQTTDGNNVNLTSPMDQTSHATSSLQYKNS